MTFTIEPMINEGSHHCVTWPDGWTAVTKDGKRSAQFEHTLLVHETGVEVLTCVLHGNGNGFPAFSDLVTEVGLSESAYEDHGFLAV